MTDHDNDGLTLHTGWIVPSEFLYDLSPKITFTDEEVTAALAAYYDDPERAFAQGSVDRMRAALTAAWTLNQDEPVVPEIQVKRGGRLWGAGPIEAALHREIRSQIRQIVEKQREWEDANPAPLGFRWDWSSDPIDLDGVKDNTYSVKMRPRLVADPNWL